MCQVGMSEKIGKMSGAFLLATSLAVQNHDHVHFERQRVS